MKKYIVLILAFCVTLLMITQAYAQTIDTAYGITYMQEIGGLDRGYYPDSGESWAVTDGLAVFSFFITPTNTTLIDYYSNGVALAPNSIYYQSGYEVHPLNWLSNYMLFLNPNSTRIGSESSVEATYRAFTLTNGVTLETPAAFIFDAVWSSGPTRLSLVELNDPMTPDANGNRYFTPSTLTSSTYSIKSCQTSGTIMNMAAINLPNGDVIIGTSEQVTAGTYASAIYHYFRDAGSFAQVYATDASGDYQFYEYYPAYFAGTVYYLYGVNEWTDYIAATSPYVTLYAGDPSNGYLPSVSAAYVFPFRSYKFMMAADSTYLYVMAEDGQRVFMDILDSTLTITSWTFIGETQILQADVPDTVGIFLTTNRYSVGAHFYMNYISTVDGNMYVTGLFTHDGSTFEIGINIGELTATDYPYAPFAPSLTGATYTPWNYNPDCDFMSMHGYVGNPQFGFLVMSLIVSLPTNLVVYNATTITYSSVHTSTSTVTITTPAQVTADLLSPIVMLIVVAIPAAVFGSMGAYFGGGKAGISLMLVGVGIGIVAGIVYKIYPSWTLVLMILAIVAAYLNGRASTEAPTSTEVPTE